MLCNSKAVICNVLLFVVPSGVVAFLEEDHYVTPDFLWVLNLMETLMTRNLCKGCNLLSMGTYLKSWNIRSSHDTVSLVYWCKKKFFLLSFLYPSFSLLLFTPAFHEKYNFCKDHQSLANSWLLIRNQFVVWKDSSSKNDEEVDDDDNGFKV